MAMKLVDPPALNINSVLDAFNSEHNDEELLSAASEC